MALPTALPTPPLPRRQISVPALEAEVASCVSDGCAAAQEPGLPAPAVQPKAPSGYAPLAGVDSEGSKEGGLWGLASTVFLPQIPVWIVNMLAAPVLPQYIVDHYGLSVATAGLAVSCMSLAPVMLDIPGNLIADRVGPHSLGIFGVVCCFACGVIGIAADVTGWFPLLLLARVLNGIGQSTWQMSRVLLVSRAPPALRARALAIVGMMQRVGSLLGPLLGSRLVASFTIYGVFVAQSVCGLLVLPMALLPVLASSAALVPDYLKDSAGSGRGGQGGQSSIRGMLQCVAKNRVDYLTAGGTLLLLNVLRQAKDFLIVIKILSLGGGATESGLAVSLAYAFDVGCSPISGILMSRLGRRYSMGPALLLLGAACGLLGTPVAGGLSGTLACACLGGAGNGLSSGLGMCVGSDLAVKREREGRAASRAEFLGPWREMMDVGQLLGPSVVGAVVTTLSLPAAAATCAVIGAAGVLSVVTCVAETADL